MRTIGVVICVRSIGVTVDHRHADHRLDHRHATVPHPHAPRIKFFSQWRWQIRSTFKIFSRNSILNCVSSIVAGASVASVTNGFISPGLGGFDGLFECSNLVFSALLKDAVGQGHRHRSLVFAYRPYEASPSRQTMFRRLPPRCVGVETQVERPPHLRLHFKGKQWFAAMGIELYRIGLLARWSPTVICATSL